MSISPEEAIQRLRDGNRRFAQGESREATALDAEARRALVAGQQPFAVILGCADSRVPAEIVFDQGPGALFVVRVAGNVAGDTQIGSVEYAAEVLGSPLVVVLGHTGCGAVAAALDHYADGAEVASPQLRAIVEEIGPAVRPLLDGAPLADREGLAREAVRANVRTAVDRLGGGSEILGRRLREGALRIVGAEYALDSGVVEFLGGAAEA